jgi:hypothetical protein
MRNSIYTCRWDYLQTLETDVQNKYFGLYEQWLNHNNIGQYGYNNNRIDAAEILTSISIVRYKLPRTTQVTTKTDRKKKKTKR